MILRIIPLTFFLFSAFLGLAQTPKAVTINGSLSNGAIEMVCPPGANPSAGDSDQILFPSAQSTDVRFLCFGDSMIIDNIGPIDLSGDPDPTSNAGVTYAFFDCLPTLNATDITTLATDPCITDDPDPSPNAFYAVQDLILPNGDATFFNDGNIQMFFNSGDPVEIFFAAITIDDFGAFSYEDDGLGGPIGPCIDVNINDVFSVVYLNEITVANINTNAGGNGCTGTMEIFGGLAEFDNSNYNFTIELASDPTITGNFIGQATHTETLTFNVPQPGMYNINITDDTGCSLVVPVDMAGCTPVVFNIPDINTNPATNVCVGVTVEEFTDIATMQFTMEWDPAVIQFDQANGVSLNPGFFFSNPVSPGVLTVSWAILPFPIPTTLADGDIAFEVCFDAVGALGTSSPVSITGSFTTIELTTSAANSQVGVIINNGSVNIISGNIGLDFTSCSSTQALSNGNFTVTPNGGNPPYTYDWELVGMPGTSGNGIIPSNGETVTIGPLAPGDYSITVTDATNDLQVSTVTVADADALFVQVGESNPTCSTSSDGCAIITQIIGGVPPFTNAWSNGAMNMNMICGLTNGNYFVTVTDANGCASSSVGSPATPEIVLDTFSLTHVTCPGGGSDGAITVIATGGTPPAIDYSYVWSTADTGPSISNLPPGNYCVTVTDDNLCSDVMCLDVVAPILPSFVQFDSISVTCPNDANGQLVAIFNEGSAPISNYTWSVPGGIGNTLTGITAGDYTVTVTADDGCTAVASATLFAPPEIMADVIATSPTCPGDSDGQIQLIISGGTTPYNILWDNGSTFPVLPALACDTSYSVTISDANNCDEIIQTIFLDCPPAIGNQFTNLNDVTCFSGGTDNGSATAIAFGGTAGTGFYNYTWSSGEIENNVMQSTATQLARGINTVTIVDGNCSIVDTVMIGSPPDLIAVLDTSLMPSCFGDADGSLTMGATGGTPPYDFQWVSPLTMGPTLDNIAAGTYNVVITDFNDCIEQTSVALGQPDLFEVMVDTNQIQLVGCSGDSTGIIGVFPSGGNVGTVTYEWSNNVSTTSVANGLTAGTYSITATDPLGCVDEVQYTLNEPPPVYFEIGDIIPPACFGFQTVVTIDSVSGGIDGAYRYSVDFGPRRSIDFAIPILGGREHVVTVFDIEGCSSEQTIFVDQPEPVVVDLGEDIEIQLGDSTILDPFTGVGLFIDSVVWSPEGLINCLDRDTSCLEVSVSPLQTTAFQLTIFDQDGCTGTDEIIVDVDRNRNVFIPNVFSPNGDGRNDIFKVFIGPGVENINYMKVFDRWGEILFDIDEAFVPDELGTIGWDGTLNGKTMNPGVYVYLIEVEFVDGLTLLYRGDVTLLY